MAARAHPSQPALSSSPVQLLTRKKSENLHQRMLRKRRGFRGHLNAYLVVNTALFLIYLITALASGAFFPWFLFPAIGWGIGLGIHGLNYRDWISDQAKELEQAKLLLLTENTTPALSAPSAPTLKPDDKKSIPESRWQNMLRQCRSEIEQVRESLKEIDGGMLHQDLVEQLEQGLRTLEHLTAGAERIERVLHKIIPGGMEVLEQNIRSLEQQINHTKEERLRKAHLENRDLLVQRKAKVVALQTEEERMWAIAQGFLFAIENLQLDSARLKNDPLTTHASPLLEPIARLSQEIEILQQVEAELAE